MVVISLSLLWSLVEVNPQQTPYVSFNGETLANHSYLNFSHIGYELSGDNSVQCHTDLRTCCSSGQGMHRGDWYFPNGHRLPFDGTNDIHQHRDYRRVDLRRKNNLLVILLCFFPVPGQPIIFLVGKSPNSLNFTWNVSNTTDAITYTVEWEKPYATRCKPHAAYTYYTPEPFHTSRGSHSL